MSGERAAVEATSPVEDDRALRLPLWRVASGFVLATAASALVSALLLASFAEGREVRPHATPAPRAGATLGLLEQAQFEDPAGGERGVTQRAQQRASLDRYEWVDRERGVVRIPIARAIELLVSDAGAAPGVPREEAPRPILRGPAP